MQDLLLKDMKMDKKKTETSLDNILQDYQESFSSKEYPDENNEIDILMEIFDISPETKRQNRQYWGRELSTCWRKLVIEICHHCSDYKSAVNLGKDELYHLVIGEYAVCTKYRIGSGDAGTLKKFKADADKIIKLGFKPLLLILRNDNLNSALLACASGGWKIITGKNALDFIKDVSEFDLESFIITRKGKFKITR
jgi:hypothetical protein